MAKEEISISLDSLKKNWFWIVLGIILLSGLFFRYHHVDYPIIGYHNWKDSRYLEEARNFAEDGFFKNGFFVAELDYPAMSEDPSGAHGGEFPTISIIIAFVFMVFGESIYAAKLTMILISLASIFMMYLVIKELFEREDLALASAFAVAVMPLLVFFSHNVQVVDIALILTLIGVYFYVVWVKGNKGRDLVLASFFIMFAAVSKYDYLVIGIPMIMIFPWKRLEVFKKISEKTYPYIASIVIALLVPLHYWYFNIVIPARTTSSAISSKLIDISVMFTSGWWTAMKAYTADNYTILGFFIALFGIAFFLLFFKKKDKGYRFFLGYIIGAVLYYIIMSDKLGGHSYHQMPLAPFFAFMISYCFVVVGTNLSNMVKIKHLKPLIIVLLFFVLYFPSATAWNRQFDTQFWGLDVAGEYINVHSYSYERIIHSGGQDYGILWHADRKGIDGGIPSVEEIKKAENDLNVTWIFVYKWGLSVVQEPEKWDYITSNYALKQIAFMNNQPLYLLFKRGGSFNQSLLPNMTGAQHEKTYETTSGTVAMQWIDFD